MGGFSPVALLPKVASTEHKSLGELASSRRTVPGGILEAQIGRLNMRYCDNYARIAP